jgi:hypothetical protein
VIVFPNLKEESTAACIRSDLDERANELAPVPAASLFWKHTDAV